MLVLVMLAAIIFLAHAQVKQSREWEGHCFQGVLLPVSPLAKRKWVSSHKCICLAHGASIGVGITGS